jgi:diguanylate cyclase (GGDEF)-like protein
VIGARSGPALGAFYAAFDSTSLPDHHHEFAALNNGARLATLAFETRRLYTDLRKRSEFDPLTDMHNRFSMDKHIDALMEESWLNRSSFGIVFIDLDEFKPVNDRYGHQVGDLFLQEVSSRMKRQLRSGDILARLGGDEFAALISSANNRTDVEEAAKRLEHTFDDVFVLEDNLIHGAASFGIALYPEDGSTKELLLSVADAAMYANKMNKKLAMQQQK